jgi:lipopolysaccharide export system permease protein
MRSAGVSVWQFLAPALALAALLGLFNLAAVDPIAANMYESYQRMDQSLLRRNASLDSRSRAWRVDPSCFAPYS